jgi:VanZ family protein
MGANVVLEVPSMVGSGIVQVRVKVIGHSHGLVIVVDVEWGMMIWTGWSVRSSAYSAFITGRDVSVVSVDGDWMGATNSHAVYQPRE